MAENNRRRGAVGIVEDIIDRIQRGELRPGEHLKETELARFYGTSRGPVREALKALEARLWVNMDAGRGARVMRIDDSKSIDSIAISSVLMGLCARLATLRATEDDLAAMMEAARELKAAAESDDLAPDEFLALGRRTWFIIARAARSPELTAYFENSVQSAISVFASASFKRRKARKEAGELWARLVVAIKMRDPQRAEDIARVVPLHGLDELLLQSIEGESISTGLVGSPLAGVIRLDSLEEPKPKAERSALRKPGSAAR